MRHPEMRDSEVFDPTFDAHGRLVIGTATRTLSFTFRGMTRGRGRLRCVVPITPEGSVRQWHQQRLPVYPFRSRA